MKRQLSKERALHDLNAIKMTMKMQNTKEEYNAMLENFDSVEQFINQPTVSNEEALEALNEIIFYELSNDSEYYYKDKIDTIKQAITTPKKDEYKQLLDKIELIPEDAKHHQHYNLNGEKWRINDELYNILKQLKSLGGK